MRHAVFAHRDFNFHARVIDLAQHLGNAPHRLAVQSRRLDQLDHHHLASARAAGGPARDQDVLAIALVFGCHQPHAAFLQQTANDGLR